MSYRLIRNVSVRLNKVICVFSLQLLQLGNSNGHFKSNAKLSGTVNENFAFSHTSWTIWFGRCYLKENPLALKFTNTVFIPPLRWSPRTLQVYFLRTNAIERSWMSILKPQHRVIIRLVSQSSRLNISKWSCMIT
jgi:hypothetical protein